MRFDGESLAYYNNEKVRAPTSSRGVPFPTSSLWLGSSLARRCSINATKVAARTEFRCSARDVPAQLKGIDVGT